MNMFNIKKGDIVSIVGSGGKSSLMKYLGNEFKTYKTLMTTTTKIGLNQFTDFDYKIIGETNLINSFVFNNKGLYLSYKEEMLNIQKCIGYSPFFIENELSFFDIILIEADGSKQKKLKGFKKNEPVVPKNTTKTIGVINLKLIGTFPNEELIHNLSEFLLTTKITANEKITTSAIFNIITSKNGLFKNSIGEKILFINMLDTTEEFNIAKKFIKDFNLNKLVDNIVLGSVNNNTIVRNVYYE